MEYLQYYNMTQPTYNVNLRVLNLIINGIPSIRGNSLWYDSRNVCFKPYYKWNTFNTLDLYKDIDFVVS